LFGNVFDEIYCLGGPSSQSFNHKRDKDDSPGVAGCMMETQLLRLALGKGGPSSLAGLANVGFAKGGNDGDIKGYASALPVGQKYVPWLGKGTRDEISCLLVGTQASTLGDGEEVIAETVMAANPRSINGARMAWLLVTKGITGVATLRA
jgi:hypothetical protein